MTLLTVNHLARLALILALNSSLVSFKLSASSSFSICSRFLTFPSESSESSSSSLPYIFSNAFWYAVSSASLAYSYAKCFNDIWLASAFFLQT